MSDPLNLLSSLANRYNQTAAARIIRRSAETAGSQVMRLIIAIALLALVPPIAADDLIKRTAETCPTGFYRSGSGFCTPYSTQRDTQTITRIGDRCPVGWYRTSEHTCRAYTTRTQERVTEQRGGGCPTGWYRTPEGTCKQF